MEIEDSEKIGYQAEKARRRKYSSEQLIKALKTVKEGKYSLSEAAKKYSIPRQTLSNKYLGKTPAICDKPGPEAVLGKDAEKKIEEWMLNMYRRGFFPHKEGLTYSVKMIVESIPEENRQKLPFKNNTPGKGWFCSFKKRHPKILEKYSEYKKSKHKITDGNLNNWFSTIETILEEDDAEETIFDPSRIYIMDEIIVKLVSENGLNLSERKKSTVGNTVIIDEDEISFLFAANALGQVAPLMIITKSNQESEFLSDHLKTDWRYESTDSGTVTCETFYRYIADSFYPYLHDKQNGVPVVIFLGSNFPYSSLPLSSFCETNGISVISLPQNSIEIESLESTVFNALNTEWRSRDSSNSSDNLQLKLCFLSKIQSHMNTQHLASVIVQRFQANRLYPFNAEGNTKISRSGIKDVKNYSRNPVIDYLENNIPREILVKFRHRRVEGIPWDGDVQYSALYDFWSSIINDLVINGEIWKRGKSPDADEDGIEIKYVNVYHHQ